MRDQLDFVYAAGETRRFHTVPVLRTQNVAAHSWHVTMLAQVVYGQDEPGITPVFLMACLTHDMAECHYGDMPSPAKRGLREYISNFRETYGEIEQAHLSKFSMDWEKFLSDEEKRRLKFLDSCEGALYCCRERAMGNKCITDAYINFASYIADLLREALDASVETHPVTIAEREWKLFNYITGKWSEADD